MWQNKIQYTKWNKIYMWQDKLLLFGISPSCNIIEKEQKSNDYCSKYEAGLLWNKPFAIFPEGFCNTRCDDQKQLVGPKQKKESTFK